MKIGMANYNIIIYCLFFLLCQPLVSLAFHTKSNETDQSALLFLKSHITWDADFSPLLSNWTDETSVCNWIGIKCSSLNNRVVALNISYSGLHGTIPPHIANLSFLRAIDISRNTFHGQLPREFRKLRRLENISLNGNNFSGEIPGWFGSLPHLQRLNLGNNTFSGSLPNSFFNATKLESLDISYNQLNGYVPQEIGNLRNLKIFDMEDNHLKGPLPLSIFNLSSLEVIALTRNRLSGNLPMDICSNLPKLARVYLSGNQFSGNVESRFGNCSDLQLLSLSSNRFTGQIPPEIGNLTRLEALSFAVNQFQGQIPTGIDKLQKLFYLFLSDNFLSGPIPPSIFNLSSLFFLHLSFNNLTGSLPSKIGEQLPNLEIMGLSTLSLSGVIPASISNLTQLTFLELSDNRFTGSIPSSLGDLRVLNRLNVGYNFLTTDSTTWSIFVESLTNCRSLEVLNVAQNPLNTRLLPSMGNFSTSLRIFEAGFCGITGNIPPEIGNLIGLYQMDFSHNSLTGILPSTIKLVPNLQGLDFESNQITGFFPNFLCNMKQLTVLRLGDNKFYGQVPRSIGNMTSLTYLYLERNEFSSALPIEVGSLRNLLVLDVHSNYLSGNITPTLGNLITVITMDLSENSFSGYIPSSIGSIASLTNLSLAHNKLQGEIPESFGNLLSLGTLNLSHNNLTGEIPARLAAINFTYLDVSFNHLRGRIPSNGSFLNFTADCFLSNDALCGGAPDLLLPPCMDDAHKNRYMVQMLHKVAYIIATIALLVMVICGIIYVYLKKKLKAGNVSQVDSVPASILQRVSFYEIQRATNGFHESNLLGTGSFGKVYKGILRDGTTLAFKVFNLELEGAFKSFETECKVIGRIRHRNLVKVISSCSNLDFKAMVLEYMPNGSLERWLYSHNLFLDFLQRLNVMIDVASALDYLHHGYTSPIVHCDLKPSNILLDEQMIGHVCDFGISKLLGGAEIMVQTMTLATIGYTAPEYGSEGLVSTSCDVYSFGILLMETFSRKKPTNDMFADVRGLREMVDDGLRNHTIDFIDQNMLNQEDKSSNKNKIIKCIASVMNLALECAKDSPEQRMDTNDILVELEKTKFLFLS